MQNKMEQVDEEWVIETRGRGFHALDGRIAGWLEEIGAEHGWVHVFVPHTSASVILQENADPDVQRDILDFLERIVPDGDPVYRHSSEGADDMSAHLRTMLGQNQSSLPVRNGRLFLGTWQGLFLFEHRKRPLLRRVLLGFVGRRNAGV